MNWKITLFWTSVITFLVLLLLLINTPANITEVIYGDFQAGKITFISFGMIFFSAGLMYTKEVHEKEMQEPALDETNTTISLLPWWLAKLFFIFIGILIFFFTVYPKFLDIVMGWIFK
jgi:hypothetical protein